MRKVEVEVTARIILRVDEHLNIEEAVRAMLYNMETDDSRVEVDETSWGPVKIIARYYTIAASDVGKLCIKAFGRVWPVSNFLGHILLRDVGKRVYCVPCDDPRAGSFLQVENDEQLARRLATEEKLTHSLIIRSLDDGMAGCSVGDWSFSQTGRATKADIEREFRKHLKCLR